MIAAITAEAAKYGWTVNNAWADSNVKVNIKYESNVDWWDRVAEIARFGSHIIRVDHAIKTLYLIDMENGAESVNLNGFEIDEESGRRSGSIIKKLVAKFTRFWRDNVENEVKSEEVDVPYSTPYESGIEQAFQNIIQGVVKSGGELIYADTDITYAMAKYATIYYRKEVNIKRDGFSEYKPGIKLVFDNERAAGYIIVTSIQPDDDDLSETFSGKGEFTLK